MCVVQSCTEHRTIADFQVACNIYCVVNVPRQSLIRLYGASDKVCCDYKLHVLRDTKH